MNNIHIILDYFIKYGYVFLAIIVFLEYLNFPGLPGGIILPAAGMIVKCDGLSFPLTLIISVASGVLASLTLYFLGVYLGSPALDKLKTKYPKCKNSLDKTHDYLYRFGSNGLIISRVIPVARTLVSVVAGVLKVKLTEFTLYSTVGISLWNFTLIFIGYQFGHFLMK